MANNREPGPPDPSHDDLSNPGPRRPDAAVVENEAHDRNDDGPGPPEEKPDAKSESDDTPTAHAHGEKRVRKPLSDMAPPGQDALPGDK